MFGTRRANREINKSLRQNETIIAKAPAEHMTVVNAWGKTQSVSSGTLAVTNQRIIYVGRSLGRGKRSVELSGVTSCEFSGHFGSREATITVSVGGDRTTYRLFGKGRARRLALAAEERLGQGGV